MKKKSLIISRNNLSPSVMMLRAPKYVHRLQQVEISARFLRGFKTIKILTQIPDEYHWKKNYDDRENNRIREVLLKHSKTCRKRYDKYFNIDFRKDDKYSIYKGYHNSLIIKFYERQIAWDKYCLSVFSADPQYWKDFLTKCSIHNLFIDLSLEKDLFGYFSIDWFNIDVSRLARHLIGLKGLEVLNIRISSFDRNEHTLKFLKQLNQISPLLRSETNIRLVLMFGCESDSSDMHFQIIGSLPDILQRIAHLKIWFYCIGEIQFKSFVDFTCLLPRLNSFELEIHRMGHFRCNVIEHLFDNLKVNANLQTLKVSAMKWDSRTCSANKMIELPKYKNFLSRLGVLFIHVPILTFQNLDIKPFLNQYIKAKQVEIIGNVECEYCDGFHFFVSTGPGIAERSVFMEIKDHALFVDIRCLNVEDETLVRECDVEIVNLSVGDLPRLNNTVIPVKDLSRHAVSRIFKIIGIRGFYISDQTYDLIQTALKNSAEILQMLIIRYEGHYRFWEKDAEYKISSLEYRYWDRKNGRIYYKIYEEYIYEINSESEDEDEEDETLKISYLENRNRPTERKKKRKVFVE